MNLYFICSTSLPIYKWMHTNIQLYIYYCIDCNVLGIPISIIVITSSSSCPLALGKERERKKKPDWLSKAKITYLMPCMYMDVANIF